MLGKKIFVLLAKWFLYRLPCHAFITRNVTKVLLIKPKISVLMSGMQSPKLNEVILKPENRSGLNFDI